ncbi:MAG: hypothetical protein IT260_05980 [Saprospiraceae bacterium]|nr:hypothetical protein [Saprospiraceae bacterium]
MKKSIFLIAALLMGLFIIPSCVKTDKNNDSELATSEDLAIQEGISQEIDRSAEVAIQERGGGGSCPTVTLDKPWGTWPNTLTIDYGPDGCAGPNGTHILKGKIIVHQTADVFSAGATRTLSFDQFFIDAIQVEGTRAWTNNGLNASSQWSFTVTSTNVKLSYPDGSSQSWNQNHTVTLIDGAYNLNPWDDVWSTTGTASGVNREGLAYTANITQALIKKTACNWISAGEIEFAAGGNSARVDFGNGDCDNKGTLIFPNGDSIQITLK